MGTAPTFATPGNHPYFFVAVLRAGAHIQIFRYKYRTRTPIPIIYSNVRLNYEFSTVPTFAKSVKTSLLWPGAVETVPILSRTQHGYYLNLHKRLQHRDMYVAVPRMDWRIPMNF